MPDVMELAGRIHHDMGNYAESKRIFSDLVAKHRRTRNRDLRAKLSVWKYFIGLACLGQNDFVAAHETLRQVELSRADRDFAATVAIAQATALIGMKRNEQAIPLLRTYLATLPDGSHCARARAEIAIALVGGGHWVEADTAINEMQEHHKGNQITLDTALMAAESAFRSGQFQFAEKWFAILDQPENPNQFRTRGLSGLAWTQMKNQQPARARESFQRLVNEFPESEFSAEAAMALGKLLEDDRRHLEAAEMYRSVYTQFPKSELAKTAQLRHAHNLQNLADAEHLLEARQVLTEYLRTGSDASSRDEAIYQLAWVELDLGQADQALQHFEEIHRHCPGSRYWPDATYRLAEDAVRLENYERARSLIDQLIGKDVPDEILNRVLYLQGQIAATEKSWSLVTDSMSHLLQRTTDRALHAKASYLMAESLFQQNLFVEATELFAQLTNQTDLIRDQLQPWVVLRYAQCLSQQERWSDVFSVCESGRQQFPSFPSVFEFDFLEGRAMVSQGRLEEARAAFQRVVDSANGGDTETAAMAQWQIGETYFHQEQFENAIAAYYRVDSLFSYEHWRAAALLEAGKCQEHLGNWKHAVRLYSQLIERFPNCKFRDEAQERLNLAMRQAQRASNEHPR
jgi:TolA-binding protein